MENRSWGVGGEDDKTVMGLIFCVCPYETSESNFPNLLTKPGSE